MTPLVSLLTTLRLFRRRADQLDAQTDRVDDKHDAAGVEIKGTRLKVNTRGL
jgi:hypothetical protein